MSEGVELGRAMTRLLPLLPELRRMNRRTQQMEPLQEVRVVMRRKSGQWACQVGRITRTGSTPAEAVWEMVDALNPQETP